MQPIQPRPPQILQSLPSTANLSMSISDSTVDTASFPHRKEKIRIAVVAFLLSALFCLGFMFTHLRPKSKLHSFHLNAVDDRAYDALRAPQVRNWSSLYAWNKKSRCFKVEIAEGCSQSLRLVRSVSNNLSPLRIRLCIRTSFSFLFFLFIYYFIHSSCLSNTPTYIMQIVTGSAIDDASRLNYSAIDDASRLNYVLGNVTPSIHALCSSSLSTMSVVNIARSQMQLSCKSLISWSLRVVEVNWVNHLQYADDNVALVASLCW